MSENNAGTQEGQNTHDRWMSKLEALVQPPHPIPTGALVALDIDALSETTLRSVGLLTVRSYVGEQQVGHVYLQLQNSATIFIADFVIHVHYRRQKLGTQTLAALKVLARAGGFLSIAGEIAPKDWEDVDGLKAFYESNGATVTLNPTARTGTMKIVL